MSEVITLYNDDCLTVMRGMADKSVDLTVTSPPYDNLREYGNHEWQFETVAEQLFRLTKDGGVVIWVVGDAVVGGSESGTAFRQALLFMDIGFRLHDTMIFAKNVSSLPDPTRYFQSFEYMFVLSNGRPKTFNPIDDKERKWFGRSGLTKKRHTNGDIELYERDPEKQSNRRGNIWTYDVGFNKSTTYAPAFEHPATFPEKLAYDHIVSWSNKGDVILDPFAGSGTTLVACIQSDRNGIGIEVHPPYFEIAKKRIEQAQLQIRMPL